VTQSSYTGPAYAVHDPNAHARANAVWSWTLRGDLAEAKRLLDLLTDEERDAVMEVATVLTAIAGGIEP